MKKTEQTPAVRAKAAPDTVDAVALKTPQEITHIKHKISLQQYKYWVLLLQELKAQFDTGTPPDEDGFYSMRMADLAGLIGYVPKKSEIWNDLNALKNETIAFNALGKDGQSEKYGAGFISEWKVSNSFIRFKFPSFLEKVMRGLEAPKAMFTLLNWEIFNHFTGKYEAIIYKLCKDYVGVGRTPEMELGKFREYIGVKTTEYPKFEDLNKWCIKRAVEAINKSEIADISVSPEFSRAGRKVTGLYFTVKHKKQTVMQFADLDTESSFRFAKEPIQPALQAKYMAMRSPSELLLCIERANEYGAKKEKETGKPVNYGGIYRMAITEGWHDAQAAKLEKAAAIEAGKADKIRKETEQRKEEEERKKKDSQKKAETWDMFQSLTETEKEALGQEFETGALVHEISLYKKKGFDSLPFRMFLNAKFGD